MPIALIRADGAVHRIVDRLPAMLAGYTTMQVEEGSEPTPGQIWNAETEAFEDAPEPVIEAPEPEPITQVTPVEFKMLFTSAERIAIRAAREDTSAENATVKAVLDDWFDIVDDPRLSAVNLTLQSTIDGVNFLATIGILTAERAAQVLAGEAQ